MLISSFSLFEAHTRDFAHHAYDNFVCCDCESCSRDVKTRYELNAIN